MPESKSPFLSSSTGSTRTNARSSSSMASSSGRRGAGSGSAGSSSTASGQIPPMLPSEPPGMVHAFNWDQNSKKSQKKFYVVTSSEWMFFFSQIRLQNYQMRICWNSMLDRNRCPEFVVGKVLKSSSKTLNVEKTLIFC